MLSSARDIDRQILRIAVPAIVSNVTVPLLGLVDVAITGHLGSAAYIGAIAVGGMAFNVLYWVFGFLRMGTSGMTAQALGRGDTGEAGRLLARSLGVAVGVAAALILLQRPLLSAVMAVMRPSAEVERCASAYFLILIYGAPAMLGLFSLSGWLIGMQDSKTPMLVSIIQNIVNIAASSALVFGLGLKVEGVALGTLAAQWSGFLLALSACARGYGGLFGRGFSWRGVWRREAMSRFFSVNRDIFLRTLCLVVVMLFFTSAGSRQGDVILAANTLLMQFYMLFSYVTDGFAYAGEALCGRCYGAGDYAALRSTVRRLFLWGGGAALLFTAAYAAGGGALVLLLTDEPSVAAKSRDYMLWALAVPLASTAAVVWDGVLIGCTRTRAMLVSMALAAAVFFALPFLLSPLCGNPGLWAAFTAYLLVRGAAQTAISLRDPRRPFI